MRQKLITAVFGIILISLTAYGVIFLISSEQKAYPRYEIRQDGTLFRTDAYSIDSLSCLHFNEFIIKIGGTRKRSTTICGGKYIITDRNQVK